MVTQYGLDEVPFRKKPFVLLRNLHKASSPDARWGTIQVLLSFFFFFFGLAVAAISLYDTSIGGRPIMIAALVLGLFGFLMLVWTVGLGWYFWHKSGVSAVFTVQDDRIEFNSRRVDFKEGQLTLETKGYEIIIRRKPSSEDGKHGE